MRKVNTLISLILLVIFISSVSFAKEASKEDSGDLKSEIKEYILKAIPDASIEIKDLMGDNNHYAATIRSSKFNNISKIEQHKLVYKSLKGKMGNELHALSITTEKK